MSSGLALSGVFTGIDSDAIIAKLMAINARPLANLQKQQSTQQTQLKALGDLQTQLTSLQGLLEGLHDPDTLEAVSLGSSDRDVVDVSAGAGATPGAHQITVGQLARSDREVHAGLASQDAAISNTAAQFAYTLGVGDQAVTRTLQVSTETTLQSLRDLINHDADNPGVAASILEYDDGSGLGYHLVLAARQTGGDYPITIEAATTLAGFGAGDFERTQSAQDAWLKVDGYPSGEEQWIRRDSNNVTDVLVGLTLSLKALGEAEVTANRNDTALRDSMTGMVDTYNALLGKIDAYTGYDATTKTGGVLQGDAVVNSLAMQIRLALTGTVKGFIAGDDPYTLAKHIGLSVARDGTLSLDNAEFSQALSDNYEDVLALIGADRTGASDSQYVQFVGAGGSASPGVYQVEAQFDDVTGLLLSARARLQNGSTWYDLDIDAQTGDLDGREDTPLYTLQLQAGYDGQPGVEGVRTQTAVVRMRQGFAGAAYEQLQTILDSTDGTLALKRKTVQKQIDSLAKSIDRAEQRLDKQQATLQQKYARLEATLARFESQKGQFEALLSSLANTSSSSSNNG